jgi:hypothetical protein
VYDALVISEDHFLMSDRNIPSDLANVRTEDQREFGGQKIMYPTALADGTVLALYHMSAMGKQLVTFIVMRLSDDCSPAATHLPLREPPHSLGRLRPGYRLSDTSWV